jgi:type II secretory pathway component PulC
MKRFIFLFLLVISIGAQAGEIIKTDGTDIGVTIMGSIVQKTAEDNVALIKEGSGTVKAVKRGHVILDKYKVIAVTGRHIELVTRDATRYLVFLDKFAGEIKSSANTTSGLAALNDNYSEDGFERKKGKITMTAMYRDKLVKEDMAAVLMQATAEPHMEGGQITGFKVSQIDEGSIYDKAGLRDGDIVQEINGNPLNSVAGSITLLRSLKGATNFEVIVNRNGKDETFSLDVKE